MKIVTDITHREIRGLMRRMLLAGATIGFAIGSIISEGWRAGALLALATVAFGLYWILKFKSRKEGNGKTASSDND